MGSRRVAVMGRVGAREPVVGSGCRAAGVLGQSSLVGGLAAERQASSRAGPGARNHPHFLV